MILRNAGYTQIWLSPVILVDTQQHFQIWYVREHKDPIYHHTDYFQLSHTINSLMLYFQVNDARQLFICNW